MRSVTSNGTLFFIVCSGGGIIKSSDKGVSYKYEKNVAGISTTLSDICFINELMGIIVGDNGVILKTTDAGVSWKVIPTQTTVNFEGVAFSSVTHGFAVGGKKIFRTTNGGDSWQMVNVPWPEAFHDVTFSNESNGVIVSSYAGAPWSTGVYITNDGGNSWSPIGTYFNNWGAVATNSSLNYTIVGQGIYESSNGGSEWIFVNSNTTTGLLSVGYADNLFGIATGYKGAIRITHDGGQTWSENTISYLSNASIISVAFLDSTVILIGDRLVPIRSTDKGVTWNISSTLEVTQRTESPYNYFIDQNYPNPFNPETTITFGIKNNSHVKLIISNVLGQTIDVIIDESLIAGNYSKQWKAYNLPSGIYYYKINVDNYTQTKKMVLLK